MIDPNEHYTFIDKNWNKGISFLDPKSDYWKKNRNIDQSGVRKINDALRESEGKVTREATPAEIAELKAP